jgi:hypothetical protein
MKDEISITGTYQGKLFCLVDDANNICTAEIPNKNLDDMGDLFLKVMQTQHLIDEFPVRLRNDGMTPLAFAHTELFYSETSSRIAFIKIAIDDDGDNVVLEHKKYEIKNNEIIVDEKGNLKKQKVKLVEIEE